MDSVTQAVLGAGVAAAVVPAGQRRKALLAGALLGTVPDLDVFIDFGGAVENFTYHRGFSHSLFVLAPFSVLLWLLARKFWAPVKEAPLRWLLAIGLALLTHPLLDAHTAYGTQLFWPLTVPPTSWATLFIIDPMFTLPLLAAAIMTAFMPTRRWSKPVLVTALSLSSAYLAWSWAAQATVKRHVYEELAEVGLDGAPVFATPTPFNTLLWRVVVQTGDGYLEGFDSLLLEEPEIDFEFYPSDAAALQEAEDIWAVRRLRWFSRDFLKAEVRDGRLLLSDLRMGQEPVYVFTHSVAERSNPGWREIKTELQPVSFEDRMIMETLRRIGTH
jgi:inner membrane protein